MSFDFEQVNAVWGGQFWESIVRKNILKVTCICFLAIGSQPTFTCSKLIIETLEQGLTYVQS